MNPNWGTASGAAPTLGLPEMPHSMFLFAKAFCQRWVSAMMLMWLEYGICKSRYPFIITYSQYFNEDRTIHRPKGVSQRGWEVSTNPRLIGQSSTPLITRSSTPDISNNPRHHWTPDPQHQISALLNFSSSSLSPLVSSAPQWRWPGQRKKKCPNFATQVLKCPKFKTLQLKS